MKSIIINNIDLMSAEEELKLRDYLRKSNIEYELEMK